jgi:hypothetical protein
MEFLGAIEPGIDGTAGKPEWVELIESHPQLSHAPDKQGINPFTRRPMLFKAAPDCARVLAGEIEVGMIHWAMDDSQRLAVWAEMGAEAQVATVAEEVASRLGWRYVRE